MWQRLRQIYPLQLEALPLLLLGLTIYFTVSRYSSLPDRIPTHFDIMGVPDGWGGKGEIITFPALNTGLYLMFTAITLVLAATRDPKKLINLPEKTKAAMSIEAAERLRVSLVRSLLAMKVLALGLIFYLTYGSIQVALGRSAGLGIWPILFIAAILAGVGYMVWRSFRLIGAGK